MRPLVPPRRAPETPSTRIAAILAKIPRGRVVTYGQVAAMAGCPRAPRLVVAVLKTSGKTVPWHRVLGQGGKGRARIRILDPLGAAMQRRLLEKERVRVDAEGRVDLERFGWLG